MVNYFRCQKNEMANLCCQYPLPICIIRLNNINLEWRYRQVQIFSILKNTIPEKRYFIILWKEKRGASKRAVAQKGFAYL
jgi:hypothetical protein